MQRVWATGSDHDQELLAWVSRIRDGNGIDELRTALQAARADDATVAEGQIALLAAEGVAYLCGGSADLVPQLHTHLHAKRPHIDDATRKLALETIEHVRDRSRLALWWRTELADRHGGWVHALAGLAERVRAAHRLEDAAHPTSAELAALRDDLEAALPHLRVALVPKLIEPEEEIVHEVVAPGLSLVLHYELAGKEPVPVPRSHTAAWGTTPMRAAAERTRAVAQLRIHTLEAEHHEVSIVFGSDTFTAGMAPFVDIFLDGPAPYGVLLGIPFAGGFVFHRIVDAHWRDAATDVMEHVDRLFESEEPISRELYWWRDGVFVVQPHQRVGEAILVSPSPDLLAAVADLG